MSIDELGSRIPPYSPTYDFPSAYIDKAHRAIANFPLHDGTLIQMRNRRWLGQVIPGWLRREDALKLYELSYFAREAVLELGSYHGLSTAIIARASRNSSRSSLVESIDRDPDCTRATRKNLQRLGLLAHVTARSAEAGAAVRDYVAKHAQFGFIFIDHSHAYRPVYDVCQVLDRLVAFGGFCLFHDLNDVRNRDPNESAYGVYQAVLDGLDHDRFEFYGIYGCSGLFRRVR